MIIFGNEYHFIDRERVILEKRFGKIRYIDDIDNVTLELLIERENPNYIVLNIANSPSSRVVKLLTNLNIEKNVKFIKTLGIPLFLLVSILLNIVLFFIGLKINLTPIFLGIYIIPQELKTKEYEIS